MAEPEEPSGKGPLWNLVHLNPALWIALVVATAALATSFGLILTGDQKAGIGGFILALIPIIQGAWTSARTTANKKVVVVAPDPIAQPTLVAPGEAVTSAGSGAIIRAAQSAPK